MKYFACLLLLAVSACSESGYRKGHAGAQGSQSPQITEPAGAELRNSYKNSDPYGSGYEPPRNYESSVLNEPSAHSTNDATGRGFRVNGSGYGFKR